MSAVNTTRSLRLALLGGAAAIIASSPASAATVNSIGFVNVTPAANACLVTMSGSITGVVDDSNGRDFAYYGHVTGSGNRNNALSLATIPIGQTVSLNGATINISPTQRNDYFVVAYETDNNGAQGIELARAPIPRSTLYAAGGNCRALVTNIAPILNAGPDQNLASGGGAVALAATGSDGDGDPLTYSWTQISGPTVTLTGANTDSPSFTAPVQTNQTRTLVFRASVTDGIASPVTDEVTVTIAAGPNTPPTVNAGPDATITPGAQSTLAATGTDFDGDFLNYQWTQVSGPTVTLSNANTSNATFTAPAANGSIQSLVFQVVANDGASNSAPDQVILTIPANTTPIANAGLDRSVFGLTTVTLNGSASTDGDGDPLTYTWVQTGGPAVTLSSASAISPTFTAPAGTGVAQNLTFDLVVNDGTTSSVADSVTITVAPNRVPVANAGADQGPIDTGNTITLNGGGSTDPDGDPLTYTWTQVAGPAVTLTNPNSANPSFVAPAVTGGTQDIVFQLVVSDGQATSTADQVRITIRSVGTITIVQRVQGSDGTFTYSSSVSPLAGSITTSGGIAQRQATLVPAGSYSFSVADARAAGYVVTAISCNDNNSVPNLVNRSIALSLSANENLICTITATNTREAALTAITNFVTARNGALLANQPDLQRRLDRLAGRMPQAAGISAMGLSIPGSNRLPVSLSYSTDRSQASTSLGMVRSAADREGGVHKFDLWAEANFGSLSYPGHKGTFRLVYVGADYLVGKDVLVGAVVQFDRFSRNDGLNAPGAAEGEGWMAGPYATVRVAPSLYLDVRAAWGSSDNRVSPLGSYVDSFETTRGFYSGSLIGQFALGGGTELRPEVSLRYLDEKQKAYSDFYGVIIPGQSLGMGDISFKPRLMHTFQLNSGWSLRPYGEAQGILTFGSDAQSVIENALRMRIEGGLDLASPGSLRVGLSGFHDGIGSDSFRNSGIRVMVSFGF